MKLRDGRREAPAKFLAVGFQAQALVTSTTAARGLVAVLEIALMVGMDASVGAHKDVMLSVIWRPNESKMHGCGGFLWHAMPPLLSLTSVCSRLRQDPPPKKFVVPEAPEPQRVPGHCDASLCE